jgi:hypothetical protein
MFEVEVPNSGPGAPTNAFYFPLLQSISSRRRSLLPMFWRKWFGIAEADVCQTA